MFAFINSPFYVVSAILCFVLLSSFLVSCCDAVMSPDRFLMVSWSEYRENLTVAMIVMALVVSAAPILNFGIAGLGLLFLLVDIIIVMFNSNFFSAKPLSKREKQYKKDIAYKACRTRSTGPR